MKYVCDVCGYVYDEDLGDQEHGISPGTKWEELPEDFKCPVCGVDKDNFSAKQFYKEYNSPGTKVFGLSLWYNVIQSFR